MPEFIAKPDFIPVPLKFVEDDMLGANGAYVKVYLYALGLASRGLSKENSDIAKALNLLESDVVNAFEYWSEHNVLKYNQSIVSFTDEPLVKFEKKKETADVLRIMTENKTLSELCQLAQGILGKTLNDADLETLYWFYDELGFSPEVISMLLEYCVSKNKRNMKYIEKVAIGWHENGITTMNAAETFISDEAEKNSYFYSLRKLFGIDNRNLSKSEESYLKAWRDDYDMSEEMVALAYEYCVMQTNKLSFPYMNSIIKRWYENNITTVPEAEQDRANFRSSNKKKVNEKDFDVYSSNVDYDEIEKIMNEKY